MKGKVTVELTGEQLKELIAQTVMKASGCEMQPEFATVTFRQGGEEFDPAGIKVEIEWQDPPLNRYGNPMN